MSVGTSAVRFRALMIPAVTVLKLQSQARWPARSGRPVSRSPQWRRIVGTAILDLDHGRSMAGSDAALPSFRRKVPWARVAPPHGHWSLYPGCPDDADPTPLISSPPRKRPLGIVEDPTTEEIRSNATGRCVRLCRRWRGLSILYGRQGVLGDETAGTARQYNTIAEAKHPLGHTDTSSLAPKDAATDRLRRSPGPARSCRRAPRGPRRSYWPLRSR